MVGDNRILKHKRIFSMEKIRLNKGDTAFLFFVLIYIINSLFPYFTFIFRIYINIAYRIKSNLCQIVFYIDNIPICYIFIA